MAGKHRFLELDGLRGIAALWVVIFHYTFGVGFFWLNGDFAAARSLTVGLPNIEGLRAVDLFFIVSGFVIFMTLENTATLAPFAVSRISRLFPAFLFAVLLASLIAVSRPLPAQTIFLHQFALNLTMLEQYFGAVPIDPVYWSLTFELGFYVSIACVFACGALSKIEPIGAAWVLMSFLALKLFPSIGAHIPWRLQAATALPYAALFYSGILFYRLRRHGPSRARLVLLGLCYLEYVAFQDIKFVAILSGIYLLFALAASGKARFLTWRPLTFLGTVSYALYLTHNAIGFRLQLFNHALGMAPWLNLAVTLAAAILLAAAVTFAIDRPGQRLVKTLCRRWKRAAGNPELVPAAPNA